ncbi:MAG: hypothetical protein Crog4KO_30840 [Crocinitomicaceae bacterium]
MICIKFGSMSKKASKKESKDMLDDALIAKEEQRTAPKSNDGEVNLLEYSKTAPFSFNADHYMYLFIGLGINILGYVLMIGGGSDDPAKFDKSELFSETRITIAPMLIVLGYAIIAYAIMRRAKAKKD